jgi:hypothetical protein
MRNKGLFGYVWLAVLLILAWNLPAHAAEDGAAATVSLKKDADKAAALKDAIKYCLENWRTLPAEAVTTARDIVVENSVAVLVLIGGHAKGKGKTTGTGIPPPPTGTGSGGGGTGGGGSGGGGGGTDPGNNPEPSSLILGVVGIVCASLYRARRRAKISLA